MGNPWFGSKATAGLCQALIALMPPHSTYIETHLGGGAIMRRKPGALRNIGIDLDARALSGFECGACGRGRAAIDELGVIPRYGGVLVHDRWASYFLYPNCGHALCGAHLLRDLRFVEDAHGHAWARRMAKLLTETCRQVREHPDRALDEAAFKAVRRRYRTILTQAKRELPAPPQRIGGRRGRIARSDAQNLHEALLKHEDAALRFARDPDVPFTNNRAERDVRMAKVKQKVSGCFRSLRHAETHCRISSYLQSMALQGWNPIAAIEIALNGKAADGIQQTLQDTPPEKAQGGE